MNKILLIVGLQLVLVDCQNSIDNDYDELGLRLPMRTTSTTFRPPPNPFVNDLDDEEPLAEKLEQLDKESLDLIIDYIRHGRKFYGSLRRRLVLYVMKFAPVQEAAEASNNPRYIHIIEKIKHRFRTGLNIKYSSLKSRVDRLVAHLLAPIFAPFMLLQPDEIRPLFQSATTPSSRFAAPVSVPTETISNDRSAFAGLEFFPSSLPMDKWPRWNPQQFGNPVISESPKPTIQRRCSSSSHQLNQQSTTNKLGASANSRTRSIPSTNKNYSRMRVNRKSAS